MMKDSRHQEDTLPARSLIVAFASLCLSLAVAHAHDAAGGTARLESPWCGWSGSTSPEALAQEGEAPASPTVRALAAAIEAERAGALDDFWGKIGREGAPLVEPHEHLDSSLVTFAYRGGPTVQGVRLSSGLNALLIEGVTVDVNAHGRMRRSEGTDLWYLSFVVGRDLRASYRFAVTISADSTTETLDTLNRRVYRPDRQALRASLLELPEAPPQPWDARAEETGSWRQRRVEDRSGEVNDVFVYLPAGRNEAVAALPHPR